MERTLTAGDPEKSLTPAEVTEQGKFLPTAKPDQLTLLKLALRDISNSARSKGLGKGLGTTLGHFEEMGISPTQVSGDVVSNIISFVEDRTTKPIESQFKSMEDILELMGKQQEKQQQTSRQNLASLIQTGGIAHLEDKQLKNLALATGMPLEQLQAIKNTYQVNEDDDSWMARLLLWCARNRPKATIRQS